MGFLNVFRSRMARQPMQFAGHIADSPETVLEHGEKYMTFYLTEAGDTAFRLKMLPTTPMRRKGDRVVVTYTPDDGGAVIVEALYAAPEGARVTRTM